MGFKGWAAGLNGVIIAGGCEHGQEDWDESTCGETEMVVIDRLTAPPDGLGLPGYRTQDTTFMGRDGVKHFDDYYGPRFITLQATIGPNKCDKCGDVRKQVRNLIRAWSRQCETGCDDELVIFTPCGDEVYDEFPVAKLLTTRTNLMAFNSRGQAFTENCATFEFSDGRGFAGATGVYENPEEVTNLPATIPDEQVIARKRWTSDVTSFCRDYGTDRCYDLCYENEIPGDNAGAGFIMGCTGLAGHPVTPGNVYAMSGYLRSSKDDVNVLVRVWFYDNDGQILSSEDGEITNLSASIWTRIAHAVVVPTGAVTMMFALDTASGGATFQSGDTLDATGVLVEQFASADGLGTPPFDSAAVEAMLGDYFDGQFSDSDNPVLGGERIEYYFEGDEFASPSVQEVYEYVPGPDRELNGPFGVVGRARIAEVRWRSSKKEVADVLLRFDGIDHRLNILDACGTPWSYDCVQVEVGSEQKARCYDRCYDETEGTRCYDQPVPGSVSIDPEEVDVLGDLTVYPTITLNPSLTSPRIQSLTNEQTIIFNGSIEMDEEPVIIYTEDMVAFQGSVNVSHLLSGDTDFKFEPGLQSLRVLSQSLGDTGTVEICWRPAVVTS